MNTLFTEIVLLLDFLFIGLRKPKYSSTKLKLTDNNVILLKTHKIELLSVLL
nr:MAG TPA: hypothetical protein [Caudoviricetes sp.]